MSYGHHSGASAHYRCPKLFSERNFIVSGSPPVKDFVPFLFLSCFSSFYQSFKDRSDGRVRGMVFGEVITPLFHFRLNLCWGLSDFWVEHSPDGIGNSEVCDTLK